MNDIWVCEDCGWQWPLKGTPYQDTECDACGGEMHPASSTAAGTKRKDLTDG